MASDTDFNNDENKNVSLQKTLANPETLSATTTTNGNSVKNDDPDVLENSDPTEQLTYAKESQDNSGNESDGYSDIDALTTMDAIMAYNRQLVARLQELEQKIEEKEEPSDSEKAAVNNLKKTLPNHKKANKPKTKTKEDAGDFTKHMPSYNKSTDTKGTNHSFEFPIGDAFLGSGNFNTTPLEDKPKEEEEPKKKNEDEETVKGDDEDTSSGGGIRISDGDKDDIVIKVEATKKGITFCIHIPRN